MSVAEEITRIKEAKENLKTSINAKLSDSQTKITDELISGYFTFVDNIESGVDINDYFITEGLTIFYHEIRDLIRKTPAFNVGNLTNLSNMFAYCSLLKEVSLFDISNVTNINSMFQQCRSLKTIPLFDTSKVTNMGNLFIGCSSLETVPLLDTSHATNIGAMFSACVSLKTVPSFDTSSATNITNLFNGCGKLETIPLLDTSNVTSATSPFSGCSMLSNESLNNILEMCTNAKKITSNKTLKYIGLTSAQATICQGLSNYQAFLDAGWTTGY